jgi:hypothetical protein
MNPFSICFGIISLLFAFQHTSYAQGEKPAPPRTSPECYGALKKLEAVREDTTSTGVPYQTYLFRYQREWLIVVADTASYYSFTAKKVKQNGVKVDSLTLNSLGFDLGLCKLFVPKELTLKKKQRKVGDLKASHYYVFPRSQQRLYASLRAIEVGKAQTFVQKSWNEIKQIPQIFFFLKAKPNEQLQAQITSMKDQAKQMKEKFAKLEADTKKAQEMIAKVKEEKAKLEEQMKKMQEEKAKKAAQDSTEKATAEAKEAKGKPKGNAKTDKDKNAKGNNIAATDKDKTQKTQGKDSTNTAKVTLPKKPITKEDSILVNMEKVLQKIDNAKDLPELKAKREQLAAQKEAMEHPENKKDNANVMTNAQRIEEMKQKIAEVDRVLQQLSEDSTPDVVSKRIFLKNKRDLLSREMKKLESNK